MAIVPTSKRVATPVGFMMQAGQHQCLWRGAVKALLVSSNLWAPFSDMRRYGMYCNVPQYCGGWQKASDRAGSWPMFVIGGIVHPRIHRIVSALMTDSKPSEFQTPIEGQMQWRRDCTGLAAI